MQTGAATWRAEALGSRTTLEIEGLRIAAHVTGEGPPIVFVHGALVNANLWRKVVPLLEGYTRVTLDLPLGSHLEAQDETADLSVPALAGLITGALESLGLRDATVVANDTGGGLTQIAATTDAERIGRLVLTSCDAFDNFPPRFFRIVLAPAKVPGLLRVFFAPMRARRLRRLPIAYGWLTKRPIEPAAEDSYVLPALTDAGVRRDVRKVLSAVRSALHARGGAEAAQLRPPRADRLVGGGPLLPARARGEAGCATARLPARVDRGLADLQHGGPARAPGRADPRLRAGAFLGRASAGRRSL